MGIPRTGLAPDRIPDSVTRCWLRWVLLGAALLRWPAFPILWAGLWALDRWGRLRLRAWERWVGGGIALCLLAGWALSRSPDWVARVQRGIWQARWIQAADGDFRRWVGRSDVGVWVARGTAVERWGSFFTVDPQEVADSARPAGWFLQARPAGLFILGLRREGSERVVVQQRLGLRLEGGQTLWEVAPQPLWQRGLRLPVLWEVAPEVIDALTAAWDRTVSIEAPDQILRRVPDAQARMNAWWATFQALVGIGLVTGLWVGLGGMVYRALGNSAAGAERRRRVGLAVLGTALWVTVGLHLRVSGLDLGSPVMFTVHGLPVWGRNLWTFTLGGAGLVLWGLGTAYTVARWPGTLGQRGGRGRRVGAVLIGLGWTLVLAVLTYWMDRLLMNVLHVSHLEVLEVEQASGFHRWVRLALGLWLMGAIAPVGSLTYGWLRILGAWVLVGAAAGVGAILGISGLLAGVPLIFWGVALVVWAGARWTHRPTAHPVLLPAWCLFYCLHPLLLTRSHAVRREFVERDWQALYQFRQTQAAIDLEQALRLVDRWLPVLGVQDPDPASAFFLWERLPFARSMNASSVILRWYDGQGRRIAESRMDWQMPWWPEPDEAPGRTGEEWTFTRRTVYDGGVRYLRVARRTASFSRGTLQVVVAIAEDLYWAPWDARPDGVPPALQMDETQTFQKLLGPFRFGAWTRAGAALTETTWFFPLPRPPARPGEWQIIETPYGERLAVYTLPHPSLDLQFAIRHDRPLDLLDRLAGLVLWDGLTLMVPAWLWVLRRHRPHRGPPRFRTLIFGTTVIAVGLLWVGIYGTIGFYVYRDYRSQFVTQTRQVAAEAQTILQDYQTFTRSTDIEDALLHWVRRTLRRDVDVFEDDRLYATSRRAWYLMGLLPQVRADPSGLPYTLTVDLPPFTLWLPISVDSYVLQFRIGHIVHQLLTGFFLTMGLSMIVSYYLSARLVRPVRQIVQFIQGIEPARLEPPTPAPTGLPEEFQPILTRFGDLLDQLRHYQAEARRAEQLAAWQEMARQVAHAVKNPLTPMQLTLDQIRSMAAAGDWARLQTRLPVFVERLQKQIETLKRRVQEFAQYSQELPLRPCRLDLRQWLPEVVQPYGTEAGPHVEIVIDGDTSRPWTVWADPEWLGRALHNILENAVEAVGRDVHIRITLRPVGTEAYAIEVWNRGPTIPDEILGRIFEPSFTTKQYGSGLGLPLARRYVELQGGTLKAENTPDGPVFRVILPAMRPQDAADTSARDPAPDGA
jgi:signal transduction histidine kinase